MRNLNKHLSISTIIFYFFSFNNLYASNLHDFINAKDTTSAIAEIHRSKNLNELLAGYAPLHLAVKQNLYEVVEHLVRSKAAKNILSIDQETPALIALKLNRTDILEYLIRSGAKIECEKLYKYISRSQKDSPEQRALEIDEEFYEQLPHLLRHEGAREVLAFAYPLFATDEPFFAALTDIVKRGQTFGWQISQVLYALINADFPNGLPSKKTVQSIALLLNELRASPSLQIKMWRALKSKRDKLQVRQHRASKTLPPILKVYKKEWDDLDAHTIAIALTEYDARLLRAISLIHLRLWLKNPQSAPSIRQCLDAHDKAINFFSYLIVSEPQPEVRRARLEKITRVVRELEALNNFWGVSHLAIGASKPEVTRLFEDKNFKNTEPMIKKVNLLADPENRKPYLKKIAQIDLKEPRLPIIKYSLEELVAIYEIRPEQFDVEWFKKLGKIAKDIGRVNIQSTYQIPSDKVATEIFDGIIFIPDDVIAEYSNLQKPWSKTAKRELPTLPMAEWSPLDLFSYLDHHGTKEITQRVLNSSVWDGKALVNILKELESRQQHAELYALLKKVFKKEG